MSSLLPSLARSLALHFRPSLFRSRRANCVRIGGKGFFGECIKAAKLRFWPLAVSCNAESERSRAVERTRWKRALLGRSARFFSTFFRSWRSHALQSGELHLQARLRDRGPRIPRLCKKKRETHFSASLNRLQMLPSLSRGEGKGCPGRFGLWRGCWKVLKIKPSNRSDRAPSFSFLMKFRDRR